MINDIVKKQKGIILPVVLIFFSFLMLLGVTFVSVGGFQIKQSMSQVNRSQAYYLAKSGADTFADYLIDTSMVYNYDEINEILNDIQVDKSRETIFGDGKIIIKITLVPSEGNLVKIIINSTAEYGGETSNASANLILEEIVQNNGSELILPSASLVLTSEKNDQQAILTGGVSIKGDVYINAKNDNAIDLSNGITISGGIVYIPSDILPEKLFKVPNHNNPKKEDIEEYISSEIRSFNDTLDFPVPVFPALPEFSSIISGNSISNHTINEDGYYDFINLRNGTLTIDLNNEERIIRVKNFNISGKLNIINAGEKGKLKLYIEESCFFGGGTDINSDGDSSHLTIFYSGINKFEVSNGNKLNGNLIVKDAPIVLKSHFTGNIFSSGTNILLDNGFKYKGVIYAPSAHIKMAGGAEIKGSIIAGSMIGDNGVRLSYEQIKYVIPEGIFQNKDESKIKIYYNDIPWD